jgi:perosamine synthetase
MTTGEGGIIVTNDSSLDAAFKSLRNQGRAASGSWLQHERLGFNYRLADINCALGISQLARLDSFLAARRRVAEWYRHHLGAISELELPPDDVLGGETSWFVYVVRLKYAMREHRNAFIEHLRANGVACASYFPPIHLQPYFRQMGFEPGSFPVTERVAETTVALPFFNRLTEADVVRVAAAVQEALHATGQTVIYS